MTLRKDYTFIEKILFSIAYFWCYDSLDDCYGCIKKFLFELPIEIKGKNVKCRQNISKHDVLFYSLSWQKIWQPFHSNTVKIFSNPKEIWRYILTHV